jgi:hypothetical protein
MNLLRRWLVLALAVFAPCAHAHKPSDAYLTLRVDGSRIEQRLDIALRDLDRDFALDADGDGALTWREVRTRWGELERVVDDALRIRADGRDCVLIDRSPPLLDDHVDGRHAVLQRTLRCAAVPARLAVDYRLFAATDPTHRGIARIEAADGAPLTRVLVPGDAATELSLASGARPRDALGFFFEGLHHIAIGLDHILFLVTLILVAVWQRADGDWVPRAQARSAWCEALRLVTAFTVAHSLTLALAAAGVLAPPSRWVESLIAASVLVAAVDNLRPLVPGPRWITVGAFGLVHGFGFAGPLQDLGLRGGELAVPLLAFNLGVEAGQLALVVLLLPLALALRNAATYRRWIVRPGSALVAGLAALWTVERALAMPLLGS